MTEKQLPRIVLLEDSVINRIAAGEVVQRPANAIKELLENSLDAGSSNVQIIIKQGGIKMLQIQDNGHGIAEADMPVVCERFTTSKLRKFEDLSQIATFGFRGEALASISHVARVTITTKTTLSQCAYKASFLDGKMTSPLTYCAGNTGTTIIAEDMFYNMPTRRNALQNYGEEARRICEVIQKYAVHNYGTAISLRRFDENIPDVRTLGGANCQTADAIRNVYGNDIAKALLSEIIQDDSKLAYSARCLCTSANYSGKKYTFLLFINNRLVENANLKRVIEQIYSVYLPKNSCPFVYISLTIAPQNLDVNVHPTKQQVHFLFEEEIIDNIKRAIDCSLAATNSSRSFKIETFASTSSQSNPAAMIVHVEQPKKRSLPNAFNASTTSQQNASSAQHSMIRVDTSQQKLDRFFNSKESRPSVTPASLAERFSHNASRKLSTLDAGSNVNELNADSHSVTDNFPTNAKRARAVEETPIDDNMNAGLACKPSNEKAIEPIALRKPEQLTKSKTDLREDRTSRPINSGIKAFRERNILLESVLNLRNELQENNCENFGLILSNFAFVGCIDQNYSLIQNGTTLLMVNNQQISTDFFYQTLLYNFGNFGIIKFEEPIAIEELAMMALDSPYSNWREEDGTKEDLAAFTRDLLVSKAALLLDYFSIQIDQQNGSISSLPLIVPNYLPNFGKLPFFVIHLASDVVWDTEIDCFRTLCLQIAKFYSVGGMPVMPNEGATDVAEDVEWKKQLEHSLFSQIKQSTLVSYFPSKNLQNSNSIVEITSLQALYKVFERC